MPRARSRSVLSNEREIVRARFISDGFLICFVKPKNCVQEFLNHFKYNINGICIRLPVKKDNINKHFQEPLGDISKSTVSHTQQMGHTGQAQVARHLCCHLGSGTGPTMLHSETVHEVGKKPQLPQLPTESRLRVRPISKRFELEDPTSPGQPH